ncbi:class C sortase [Corynebacterium caspium]|uniref:class C sortase n=1 Tax=Corynebacterium caspium TaxID=234828 RepID=UPI0012EB037C|nr:class C sortase [Corynebacterium caspium]WKD59975.1 Sortase family protein [Corynebacterium caspium DSM 44850]
MTTSVDTALPSETPKVKPKKKSWVKALPLFFVLAGLLAMLYPVIATVQQNKAQVSNAHVYSQQTSSTSPEERAAAIAAAHQWNLDNQGAPILDPWLARITSDNEDYRSYLEKLNLTDAMARVVIPKIKSDLPIYHGTTEEILQKGIGHLYGSSLPVGGEGTHAILTGHTGLAVATLWDNLTELQLNDPIYIEVAGEKLKYAVSDIRVVLPSETSELKPEIGKDQVTLITCTPYAVNSHRLLITGDRVPMDVADEEVFSKIYHPWQWWMTVVLVVAGIIIALLLLAVLRWLLANKKKKQQEENMITDQDSRRV